MTNNEYLKSCSLTERAGFLAVFGFDFIISGDYEKDKQNIIRFLNEKVDDYYIDADEKEKRNDKRS